MDREGGIEADPLGVFAQQPRAEPVKRAGPGQRRSDRLGIAWKHLAGDARNAASHFSGCTARERHQQNSAGIGAANQQMRDAMGERVGLAGSGAGNDQQRGAGRGELAAMRDRAALLRIEIVEIICRVCQHESPLKPAGSAISFAGAMRWPRDGMRNGFDLQASQSAAANARLRYGHARMIRNRSFLSRLPTERAQTACADSPALLSNLACHESRKNCRAEFCIHHRH